jgi:uncharacterized repeat protein (TIGR01451 family)
MKKILLIIFVLSLKITTSTAQWVTIPDANFASKLSQLFPGCMNGNQMDTTCADIINCNTLHVNTSFIHDLTGIGHFINLNYLDCDSNYLTTLPTLPPLLEYLDCSFNQITYLPILPDSLTHLFCTNNLLTGLPVFPGTLVDLQCNYNSITNLPAFPGSMINIACSVNQLSSLPALPSTLEALKCSNNQLTSLPSLPNALFFFDCGANQISTLPALPPNLAYLFCDYNQLTSIPPLPANLEIFSCGTNQITALPVLPGSLTSLNCNVNQLISLPTLPNSLSILLCDNNQLTSLPSLPAGLTKLFCNNNQLTSIPYLPSTLVQLNCYYNQLTFLPQVPNIMTFFLISYNNISCLSNLPIVLDSNNASIVNNPLSCVPNQTNYSLGLPFCLANDPINNPNNCSNVNISGHVYTDLNNDCNYGNNDLPTENIPVKLFDSQNNLLAISYTVNGVYSFGSLLPDSYQVKIDDNALPISIACAQSSNQSVVLNSNNQTFSSIDYPIVCDTLDLAVQSVTRQGIVFPGQVHRLYTHITNNETWYNLDCSSSNYTGTVTIEVSGPATYISTPSNALSPIINGNTFTYNITNFLNLTPQSFGLNFQTDTSAQAGDQICAHVVIASNPTDANASNNIYDFCYQVINSYDPNMKEVYPVNVLPGYTDWLTYTIHFQNTGNAPAFNIKLRDTLDTHLDLNTFEVIGSSHAANTTLYGNILAVRFNNIMLPDSTTDHDGSMGYFQYRLKPLPNLPQGTQISNTAYIYFDYNSPVVTNTTQNNFDFVTGINDVTDKSSFVLYPNPSEGLYHFIDVSSLKTVDVYNILGEKILSQTNQKQIDLRSFSKGIYFAKINGQKVIKLVKE